MARFDITDEQWERIAALLPPTHPDKRGHPWADHRSVLNGILWIMRTGAPWADLPERYAPKSTCNDRLRVWQADGTWERILQQIQSQDEQAGQVIWVEDALDATIVRAHQHAAGARRQKKRPTSGPTEIHVTYVGPVCRSRNTARRRSAGS